MGESGLTDELTEAGINFMGPGPDPFPEGAPDKLIPFVAENEGIRAVVIGYDHFVSLPKLVKVSMLITRSPGATADTRRCLVQACTYAYHVEPEFFLATNCDQTQPTPNKSQTWPETGPFISFAGKMQPR